MTRNVTLSLLVSSLCIIFACAAPKRQYSCAWTPDMAGPHNATFCVDYSAKNGSAGSPMPVLENIEKKEVKQIGGLDLFIDSAKVSAIRKKAAPKGKPKCEFIWVSAMVELQSDTGQYWSPQWDSDERKISKRLFPFYKVLVHQLHDAKCVKK